MKSLKTAYQYFQEGLMFLLILMLFLPNFIMYPMMVVLGVYLIYETITREKPKITISFILITYLAIVAWFNKNPLGLVGVALAIYLSLYVLALRRRMNAANYMKMQYYIVWSSLLNFFFVFSKFQSQWFYDMANRLLAMVNIQGLPAWRLPIYGEGYFRAYSTFDNPNFYAFVLMIVILVCFNQMQFQFTFKNYKLLGFYSGALIINAYALFLTGTRAIWLGLVVGLFVIMLMQRKWTQIKILVFCMAVGGIVLLNHPTLFPRLLEVVDHTSIRFEIWENAARQIQAHPWFGQGLFTYAKVFDNTHAHNIYFESLLSLGIVGSGLLIAFLVERLIAMYRFGYYLDYPLAIGLLSSLLIYGIFDMPLYYVQTSLLFASIFCIPKRSKEVPIG